MHFEKENTTPSPCGEGQLCISGVRKPDSFPMWSRIAMYLGEESSNPSPCGQGFTGKDSHTFKGKEP